MKHTKDEIINALNVIQEECKANPVCATCPFWLPDKGNGCQIKDDVETWEISSPRPEMWRAFK